MLRIGDQKLFDPARRGRGHGGLGRGPVVSPGVRQPAPGVAVVGACRAWREGGGRPPDVSQV